MKIKMKKDIVEIIVTLVLCGGLMGVGAFIGSQSEKYRHKNETLELWYKINTLEMTGDIDPDYFKQNLYQYWTVTGMKETNGWYCQIGGITTNGDALMKEYLNGKEIEKVRNGHIIK